MLDVPTILVVFGAILFLLALFGGGLKIKEINLPPISQQYRIGLFLLSFVFIGVGIWLSLKTQLQALPNQTSTNSLPHSTCEHDDLLRFGVPVSVFIQGQSRASVAPFTGGIVVQFGNDSAGSGVAIQFGNLLDLQGCKFLDFTATSSKEFNFLVEYKIRTGNGLVIVQTSSQQTFPSTFQTKSLRIPLTYNGAVDEVVFNFNKIGEASELVIESIQVSD
jgi:hypothetical protein